MRQSPPGARRQAREVPTKKGRCDPRPGQRRAGHAERCQLARVREGSRGPCGSSPDCKGSSCFPGETPTLPRPQRHHRDLVPRMPRISFLSDVPHPFMPILPTLQLAQKLPKSPISPHSCKSLRFGERRVSVFRSVFWSSSLRPLCAQGSQAASGGRGGMERTRQPGAGRGGLCLGSSRDRPNALVQIGKPLALV